MIGCRAECHWALEREVQRFAAIDGERLELAVEDSVRVGAARLGARGETGGRDRETHVVGGGRTAERERDALERTRPVAQLAQPRVDLRGLLERAGIKIDLRVEALELDPLVVEVPAVRRDDDRRVGERAAHGP